MEKRLKNKIKRGPAVLSVMIAAMLAVALFAALPAGGSSRESVTLGAGEHNEDLTGGLPDVKAISAGESYTLILKSDGTVWAWGHNGSGILGDGTDTNRNTPVQVVGKDGIGYLTGVTAISAGGGHSLALKNDGTVWAWGNNGSGILGDGTNTDRNTPVQVVGKGGIDHLDGVTAISAGSDYSLALKGDGTVWAWGWNIYSQLGDGTDGLDIYVNAPVQVVGKNGKGYLTGITAISAGGGHSLALKNDGTVWAWGDNSLGMLGGGTDSRFSSIPVQVVGKNGIDHLDGVTAISAGSNHSLAVKNDGTVWAWGGNDSSQLGDGTEEKRNTPVQVVGENGEGYLTDVTAISANIGHSLALKDDGTVWAWGYNWEGQLGDGTDGAYASKTTPVQVVGKDGIDYLTDVTAISAGGYHSLALKSDGTVWAWGSNDIGQLGDGTDENKNTPVHIHIISSTLSYDGTVHWYECPCGDVRTDAEEHVFPEYMYNGKEHWHECECGIRTGIQEHTFADDKCECGLYNVIADSVSGDIKMIAAGDNHNLLLKSDGTVWAWGNNGTGQLGDGTNTDRNTPVQVVGENGVGYLTGVTAVAAGIFHSLALKSDGTVWAWGWNGFGQLGDGTDSDFSNTPVQVLGKGGKGYLTDMTAISASTWHSLALKDDGTVWVWGANWYGQLGDGTDSRFSTTPVQVSGKDGKGYLTGVRAVSAGKEHSIALKNDGTVLAWGVNWDGQLGDGTNTDRNTPVQVVGENGEGYLTDVTAISAGGYHSLALKNDGTVLAWGYNGEGQLGDGTDSDLSNTPVQIVGENGIDHLNGVAAISAGSNHSLAFKSDGTVWAWGYNGEGQLGDGTDSDLSNTPVQVVGENGIRYLVDVAVISAGEWHSIVLKSDGTVWMWGYSYYIQIDDGMVIEEINNTPVHIHIISSSLSYGETEHWYECPCGDVRADAEEHLFEDIGDGNVECGCGAVYHSTDEDGGTSAGDGSAVKGNSPPVAMVFLAAVILAVSLTLMTVKRN